MLNYLMPLIASPWLLRRIVAYDRGLAGWVRVPHAGLHIIRRDRLLELAEQENLPIPDRLPDAADLVLLPEPHVDTLATTPPPRMLARYWEMLFHARIDALLADQFAAPASTAAVQDRIDAIGRSAFNEARFVLAKEQEIAKHMERLEEFRRKSKGEA